MPRPRPLRPSEARRTLVHRLGPRVDRLRQIETRFGLRPYRVFLVWMKSQGAEAARGDESLVARVEILPTPAVTDTTALARRPWSAGILPEGAIRLDTISVLYTADQLTGVRIPESSPPRLNQRGGEQVATGSPTNPAVNPQVDFYYELVEDGRGDDPPARERFRLFGRPFRAAGRLTWSLMLEPSSEPTDRTGASRASEEDVRFDDDSEPT